MNSLQILDQTWQASWMNLAVTFKIILKVLNPSSLHLHPIAVNKIFDLLRGLSCNKACGVDKISSKILKLASPVISATLTYILNQSITLCSFPDE
jgi:hypothetical protein